VTILVGLTVLAISVHGSWAQDCSSKAATSAISKSLGEDELFNCSVDIICHDFTHRGGDMVAVITCGSLNVLTWYLLTRSSGQWRLLWKSLTKQPFSPWHGKLELVENSDDLIVSGDIFNRGDADCCPTGGKQFARLHWNGEAFQVIKGWQTPPPQKTH